jgi:hypothetical protein
MEKKASSLFPSLNDFHSTNTKEFNAGPLLTLSSSVPNNSKQNTGIEI